MVGVGTMMIQWMFVRDFVREQVTRSMYCLHNKFVRAASELYCETDIVTNLKFQMKLWKFYTFCTRLAIPTISLEHVRWCWFQLKFCSHHLYYILGLDMHNELQGDAQIYVRLLSLRITSPKEPMTSNFVICRAIKTSASLFNKSRIVSSVYPIITR